MTRCSLATKALAIKGLLLAVVLALGGCVSSGPSTEYYTLFPAKGLWAAESTLLGDRNISIGIGPVVLPEFLDNPALVSLTDGQQVRVSAYQAWAGDLKTGITRVLTANLSALWDEDQVWSFPWDSRTRPDYQVRIVFEDFSGVRGDMVYLKASWVLLETGKGGEFRVETAEFDAPTASASTGDYVKALNGLLEQLSIAVAVSVARHLK